MRLLLVEDSVQMCETIASTMKRSGFAVDVCSNGIDGLWYASSYDYDIIILDIMLPGQSGLEVLKSLRQDEKDVPILLLTARGSVEDRVLGLNSGADDYLSKPFALEELLARVMALSRRRYGQAKQTLSFGSLQIDRSRQEAFCGAVPLQLQAREFALLDYLVSRANELVSRSCIEEHIYDEQVEPHSNVVDSAVCILRKKLDQAGVSDVLLKTKRGQGYILQLVS